jgi:hypothetical protein
MTILIIKYGYMFRHFLSHPQANVVTEFKYIKCAPNGIPYLITNIVIFKIIVVFTDGQL